MASLGDPGRGKGTQRPQHGLLLLYWYLLSHASFRPAHQFGKDIFKCSEFLPLPSQIGTLLQAEFSSVLEGQSMACDWCRYLAPALDIGGEFLLSCCMCPEGKPVRAFLLLLITVTAVISFTITAPTSLTNTRANFSSSQHPAKHCSVSIQQSRLSDGPCSHHSLQTALQLKALHRQAA